MCRKPGCRRLGHRKQVPITTIFPRHRIGGVAAELNAKPSLRLWLSPRSSPLVFSRSQVQILGSSIWPTSPQLVGLGRSRGDISRAKKRDVNYTAGDAVQTNRFYPIVQKVLSNHDESRAILFLLQSREFCSKGVLNHAPNNSLSLAKHPLGKSGRPASRVCGTSLENHLEHLPALAITRHIRHTLSPIQPA